MSQTEAGTLRYSLGEQQEFSQSVLWELQRRYFDARGADAWQQEEVPQYVTSNPTIAQSYAEVVFAFARDQRRLAPFSSEPLYLCELGAGSGRFAFHFLRHLLRLCEKYGVETAAFRYVLTDFTQRNVEAWCRHPGFENFFASGLLDVALFDVTQSDRLALQVSGDLVQPGTLQRPLVVLANYLFDSIPQDLFHFTQQELHRCHVSVLLDNYPREMEAAALIRESHLEFGCRPCADDVYGEAELRKVLESCRHEIEEGYLLFPAHGLRSLLRLRALSTRGLLLLTADKGEHRLERAITPAPPRADRHGSFSLSVNYHAFVRFCEQQGGSALVQQRQSNSIDVLGLLMLDDMEEYDATLQAYREHMDGFNPDEFFALSGNLKRHMPAMTFAELLGWLHFSRYDAHQLARLLPRLRELATDLSPDETAALTTALDRTWEEYFPLGEEHDLAFQIGDLLYALNQFDAALRYFHYSQVIYGAHTGTLYNQALCHHLLDQPQHAGRVLKRVLDADPDHAAATALLAEL